MALSVERFKENNILIKNLNSIQTCSMINDVCIGKTGTLTLGKMKISKFSIGTDTTVVAHDPQIKSLLEADIADDVRTLIHNIILGCNEGRFEPNDSTCRYEAKGSATEKALLDFLTQNNIDVYNGIIKRNAERAKVLMIPFDPYIKNAIYIRNDPEDFEMVDIYMIGAPDSILRVCSRI